jgi:hypothetical protein
VHVLVESYQVVMYSVHSSSRLGGRDGGAQASSLKSKRTFTTYVRSSCSPRSVWPPLALWPFGPRWRSGTGEWCVLQNAYQRLTNASPKRRLGFQPRENGRGIGIGIGKPPSRHRAARNTTYSTYSTPYFYPRSRAMLAEGD